MSSTAYSVIYYFIKVIYMELRITNENELAELVRISKEAFDSDINVGASSAGGPPEYDNIQWHRQMLSQGHLFSAYDGERLVGGALIFKDDSAPDCLYIGRIFIKPELHRTGLGTCLMSCIEALYPDMNSFCLDTPLWNTRTNAFYIKLGYKETKRDKWFAYYKKEK